MDKGAKLAFVEPMVLATYAKAELEETIRAHGSLAEYGGPSDGSTGCGGGGCGGGGTIFPP